MQVYIKSEKNREFRLHFPIFMLKVILTFVKNDEMDCFLPIIKFVLKDIKRYVRKNGHFELIDIESKGNKVKIVV